MLAIDQRFLAGDNGGDNRFSKILEVFGRRDAEGHLNLFAGGLGDEAGSRRRRIQNALHAGVVAHRAPCPLGHAEGGESRALRTLFGKERGVGDVGAGIATFDVIDAKLVKQPGNGNLVLERELDAGRLRAITQRRVK